MRLALITATIFGALIIALPSGASAQGNPVDVFNNVCSNQNTKNNANQSAVCKDKELQGQNPLFGTDGILTKLINILSIVVGIAAVIVIIASGLRFITSGNNPQEVSGAREMVIYAVVGLIIAASAQLLVRMFLSKIGEP